jgi:hypothetical protein
MRVQGQLGKWWMGEHAAEWKGGQGWSGGRHEQAGPNARFSSSWHKSFLFYEICVADRAHKVLGVVPKMEVVCMHAHTSV